MKDTRAYALVQLLQMEAEGRYLGLSLGGVPEEHRGFLTALLYGIAEHKITLDYYIGVLAKRNDLTPEARNILRIGLYQLLYMDHIPHHAVVNTAVALTKKKSEAGFINAVLRRAVREPQCLTLPPREKNPLRYLSLCYSIPLPTLRLLVADMGMEGAEAYLLACSKKAPLCLRVNTLKTTREALLALFLEKEIWALPTPHAPNGILVMDEMPVAKLPGFEEGLFFVQDEAAQIAVEALSPKKGSVLLDVCAAPGGKSFSAAIAMENEGEVLSLELHESKLSLIQKGASRLEIHTVTPKAHDSRTGIQEYVGKADYVICDVPCSGMGVLRKKPEIRYKDTADMAAIPALQEEILDTAASYLKPGGRMIYATCTVFKKENESVVNSFLLTHPDFMPIPFTVGDITAGDGMLTLLPHIHETDGFFVALLEKTSF